MQFSKLTILIVSGFAVNLSWACINPQLGERDFSAIGVVKNTDSEIIYEEHHDHKADIDGGKSKVDYKTPAGKIIAAKIVEYDCRVSAPNYVLEMKQGSDWIEKVSWDSGQLVINKPDGSKKLAVLSTDNLVIDAGFDNYIFENWQALMAGQQRQIEFLHVPANQLITLVISLVADSNADKYTSSDSVAVFKITTKSRLLRLFADSIYLGYDKTTKLLDFYSGPTNLRGTVAGLDKSRQVVINYRYN